MTKKDRHSLGEVGVGRCAKVCGYGGLGAIKRRFIDMGITPGVVICVKKVAPLGDPIEIHLRGYDLSIRRSDAGLIYVDPPVDGDIAGRMGVE